MDEESVLNIIRKKKELCSLLFHVILTCPKETSQRKTILCKAGFMLEWLVKTNWYAALVQDKT